MPPHSAIVQQILFGYATMTSEAVKALCADLPPKLLRWLGSHHPDNRTRNLFFVLIGVTKDIPPLDVAVGNSAQVVRQSQPVGV